MITDLERTKYFLGSMGIPYETNKAFKNDENDSVIKFVSTSSELSCIEDATIKLKFDKNGKFLTVGAWE